MQMEIYDKQRLAVGSTHSPPGHSWPQPHLHPAPCPMQLIWKDIRSVQRLDSGFWLGLTNRRQKQGQPNRKKERTRHVFIPWLPPCWPQVGSGSISLLKATPPCVGLSQSPTWLSLGCSNPSLPCFFSLEAVPWLLAVTNPSGSVDLSGFPSCCPQLYKWYPYEAPLDFPTWMCHLFLTGIPTSWSRREVLWEPKGSKKAAEIKLIPEQSLERGASIVSQRLWSREEERVARLREQLLQRP